VSLFIVLLLKVFFHTCIPVGRTLGLQCITGTWSSTSDKHIWTDMLGLLM